MHWVFFSMRVIAMMAYLAMTVMATREAYAEPYTGLLSIIAFLLLMIWAELAFEEKKL